MKIKLGAAKARKIRQRAAAGRPRKEGERYPSGRIKHSETEKEVQSVAIAARKRIHGIEDASPLAGYTLGRMCLDGRISNAEREAGDDYAAAIMRYHLATGIPFPSARAQDLFAIKGHDGDPTESKQRAATRASNLMMRLEGVLLKCSDGPQVKSTVYNVCVMDIEHLRMMTETQLMWLKRGLHALMFDKGLRDETL
jgi:hypothetical protein